MASIGGRLAMVRYGSNLVAGLGTWEMTGFTPEIQEDTAFGDTVKKWKQAGIGDAGEISFSGQYDPADTNGQVALLALANTDSEIDNLYFYESTSVFWRVASGGKLIMSKFDGPKFGKNELATISFTCKVSGKVMERVS
ncbi:MAG: hypothetical protein A4E65_03689 [Syntrophorhabdus sp. PtaU1.Bin153]|nr:MAG: hypothetical protein A4E65_03689 [Syntrophorhabdus sp. PtaU1.Bin153]